MKDIIFKGSSHTIGLGLDLVLSKRYNDESWLKKNGVILPPDRFDEDWEHINNNRWPKKICDTLGIKEFNYDSTPNLKHTDLYQFLVELSITPSEKLERVSHIIYEPQHTRFFHNNEQYTPAEMLQIINDSKTPSSEKQLIYDWLDRQEEYVDTGYKLLDLCIKKHKHIKFLLFFFYGYGALIDKNVGNYEQLDTLIEFTINGETTSDLHYLLEKNKLRVCDTAFCYTNRVDEFGNEKWKYYPHLDTHAGVEAQELIANNIIRYLY